MKLVRILALGATVMILAAGAVACGDDDDGDDDNGGGTTPSAQPTSPPSASTPPGAASSPTTAAPTEPAGAVSISVTAADFSFTPSALTAALAAGSATPCPAPRLRSSTRPTRNANSRGLNGLTT